ncbi:hypothetical protein QQG55_44490 [Brugia pahangi]
MAFYSSKTGGPPTTFANVSQCMVAAAHDFLTYGFTTCGFLTCSFLPCDFFTYGFLTTRPPTVSSHPSRASITERLQRVRWQ